MSSMSQPLVKCKRVFQALISIAIEELCETADSLIAPVRNGVAKPTAPFTPAMSQVDAITVSFNNHTTLPKVQTKPPAHT